MSIPHRLREAASASSRDPPGPAGWQYPGSRGDRGVVGPQIRVPSLPEQAATTRRRREYRQRQVTVGSGESGQATPTLPTQEQIQLLLSSSHFGLGHVTPGVDVTQAFLNYPVPSAPPFAPPISSDDEYPDSRSRLDYIETTESGKGKGKSSISTSTTSTSNTEQSEGEQEEEQQVSRGERFWKQLYQTALRRLKQRRLWICLRDLSLESEHLRWGPFDDLKKTLWEAFLEKLRTVQGRTWLFALVVRALEIIDLILGFFARTQGFWQYAGAAGAGAAAAFHFIGDPPVEQTADLIPDVGYPTDSPGEPPALPQ
jgi:hypothetical protein